MRNTIKINCVSFKANNIAAVLLYMKYSFIRIKC
jgi:hypothetical protein